MRGLAPGDANLVAPDARATTSHLRVIRPMPTTSYQEVTSIRRLDHATTAPKSGAFVLEFFLFLSLFDLIFEKYLIRRNFKYFRLAAIKSHENIIYGNHLYQIKCFNTLSSDCNY